MIDTRIRRAAAFLCALTALTAVLLFLKQTEKTSCMDVQILSEQEQAELGEYVHKDFSWDLQYNGQRAAVDLSTSTVYIAQNIREDTQTEDLLGTLRTASPSLEISFAPDEAFGDLAAAVKEGHAFKLNVAYGSNKYTQYNLVFTTLPVLRIDGEAIAINEKGKDICRGEMCLWTPDDPDTARYSVKSSDALWHVRGGWSATLLKTPFKLDLKKDSGDNQNLSLLGMGADDDWILNPMNLDDTKLKEKIFGTIWNQRAGQVDWNPRMSTGEYVEVVINQEYWGLFQLQRRIDDKFLNLGATDILLKGCGNKDATTVQTAFEIVCSNLPQEQTYGLVQGFFDGTDVSIVNLDSFQDVNLFMQWASAADNDYYKNMFYLLRMDENGYRMYMLPWDTDMSWGTLWDEENGGFLYDFEASKREKTLRKEYAWVKAACPDLERQMAERWFELRESLLTMENMVAIAQQEQAVLDASGAQARDTERWGLFFEGQDSLENLYKSMEARMKWIDAYYGRYRQS